MFAYQVTRAFLPRDLYDHSQYRQFPKQKPRLEVPRENHS